MGPSGDTGFTWGHYEAHGQNAKGQPTTTSGRYITVWKKVGGHWKVALDASADDAPAGDAATLGNPQKLLPQNKLPRPSVRRLAQKWQPHLRVQFVFSFT